jgi:zinc protease
MLQLLSTAAALLLAAGNTQAEPSIPYESYKLPNGLNVILHVDRSAPVVGVDVHYDVGSKDEKPGHTGFAHLFEHLMFQGTLHLPKGSADRLIEAAGGAANGGTSQDSTVYWQEVPSSALEQALYIEAERMGFMLPVIDQAKLDNQRDVVRNERRQNYEMQPYGQAWKVLHEHLWDPAFPYHWLPIGSHEDLEAATLEDVRAWFRRFYGPNNASLALAGDFDPGEARRLVARWFGGIPAGPAVTHARPEPRPLRAEERVTLDDDVELPRLYVAWQAPPDYAPGSAELEFAADVLSSGKSSRLVRRLVMGEQIAQSAAAFPNLEHLAGEFVVVATPKPGQAPERLLAEIDEEIARLGRDEPPTPAELTRARNRIESGAVFALEPVGGFGGRAATLNRYYFDTGDPGFLQKDLARYRAVTAEGVRAAVARHLRPDARVVLTVLPRRGAPASAEARP